MLRAHRIDEWQFSYYLFVYKYHREPIDIDDFVDGLHVLGAIETLELKRGKV